MIGVPGKSGSKGKGRRVHVNTCKSFQQTSINRVAVWAIEESVVDEVESKLEGDELNEQQKKALDECLGKWQEVLTSVPGKTDVLLHDMKHHLFVRYLIRYRISGGNRLGRRSVNSVTWGY